MPKTLPNSSSSCCLKKQLEQIPLRKWKTSKLKHVGKETERFIGSAVSCGCGSLLASLEVFSPAHILWIVQTTALRHSDFSFFSFSVFLCSGI